MAFCGSGKIDIIMVMMLCLPPCFIQFNLGGLTNVWPYQRCHSKLFSHHKSPQFSSHCNVRLPQFNWNPACHLWISLKGIVECGSHYYSHLFLMIVPVAWNCTCIFFTADILTCTCMKTKGRIDECNNGCKLFRKYHSEALVLCVQAYWHALLGHHKGAEPSFFS